MHVCMYVLNTCMDVLNVRTYVHTECMHVLNGILDQSVRCTLQYNTLLIQTLDGDPTTHTVVADTGW